MYLRKFLKYVLVSFLVLDLNLKSYSRDIDTLNFSQELKP